jgi:WD40 repeat protein
VTNVRVWDVGLSGDAEWLNVPMGGPGIAFTVDDRLLASRGDEGQLWNVEDAERAGTIVGSPSADVWPLDVIAVAADGTVATAGIDAGVWEPDGTFTTAIDGPFYGVSWSGDGRLLALGEDDARRTRIVDRSWEEVASIGVEGTHLRNAFALSPDGRLLAVASQRERRPDPTSARVTIWDVEQGEVLTTIPVWAYDVAFDPSGTKIATGSQYGIVDIWDVRTGANVMSSHGHAGEIHSVRFSPDGSVLATGGTDGTVRTWDPTTGAPLLVLEGHQGVVDRLAFSPDGSMLASSNWDGVGRVWALDLDDLIEIAREELTRGFTDAECRQYLHQPSCGSSQVVNSIP